MITEIKINLHMLTLFVYEWYNWSCFTFHTMKLCEWVTFTIMSPWQTVIWDYQYIKCLRAYLYMLCVLYFLPHIHLAIWLCINHTFSNRFCETIVNNNVNCIILHTFCVLPGDLGYWSFLGPLCHTDCHQCFSKWPSALEL